MEQDYEVSVLAHLLSQPRLLRAYGRTLRDYHFESTPLKILASVILTSTEKHGTPPNQAECRFLISQASASHEWPLDHTSAVQEAVNAVWEVQPSGVSADTIRNFLAERETRAVAEAMSNLPPADLLKKLPELRGRLSALEADHTSGALDLGLNFFGEGPEGLEQTLTLMESLYDSSYCLSTGWPLVDAIMQGGHRPKEVTVILAPTGGSKSATLIEHAKTFNLMGKRVVYYAIDNTREEMAERVTASQTGVAIDWEREVSQRRKEIIQVATRHNNFIFREWAPMRQHISDIRAHMQVIRDVLGPIDEKDGRPNPGEVDVVMIDSPQLMRPEGKASTEARRFDLTEIYYSVVALAKEEGKIVIATHQANREAMKAVSMGLEHVGEAIGVVQPVANVWAVAQSMPERVLRQLRLQFLKTRRPEGVGKQARFFVDRYRQTIWPDPDQEDLEDMWNPNNTVKQPAGFKEPKEDRRRRALIEKKKEEVATIGEEEGWNSILEATAADPLPVRKAAPVLRGVGNPNG